MIQKHLNFKNGTKGYFLKQGVSGEMLYGKQTDSKGGDVSSNISRNKQKMVEDHLNNGLNFSETATKMRLGRNAIGYYVKKIVAAKGEEGVKWEQEIRDRTAKNKHLKQIENAK